MGSKNRFISGLKSSKLYEYGIQFISENGLEGHVSMVSDSMVHFNFGSQPLKTFHSYGVVKNETCDAEIIENADEFIIQTSRLKLVINKKDFKTSIYTQEGQLINADAFPVNWIGTEVTVSKVLQEDEIFIGLGEKVGNLNRKGTAYTNWNTDKFAYDTEADPLYLSTPFFIGIHQGLYYGIFLNNSHRSVFNFGASSHKCSWFSAEDGNMDYYFFYSEDIKEILQQYTWLTGRMEMPPKWALGFQQCRYSYYPDHELYQLAQNFRDKRIPCDVLYLDIHYMEEYKAFTFDKERFPDPKSMVESLKEKGFKTAVILDPGIKVEAEYTPYESGVEADAFLKYPDGERYIGEVWPGQSHFPDFTNPKVRKWWSELMSYYTDLGIKGYWNDMNEPAAWGQCLPNMLEFDYEGELVTHRTARNIYGMQMTRSTREGLELNMNNERPFVLTRAGFSGIQRYAAVWTGDNVSSDEHLMLGVRMVNSLGLTGIPFCGNDVGGFVDEASPALYARWISIAAFHPFFRAHSMVNTRDAEPWSFGEEVEQIARNYISLRYQLMPMIYNLFFEATQNGMPVSRSLALYFSHQKEIFDPLYQHQFLLGEDLMIAPLKSTDQFVKVWMPDNQWYSFWNDEIFEGLQSHIVEAPIWKLPIFVRNGSILLLQETSLHLDQDPSVLMIHIYGDQDNIQRFYEDDGISYDYKKNKFQIRNLIKRRHSFELSDSSGEYESKYKTLRLFFHDIEFNSLSLNDQPLLFETTAHRFIDPVQSIDTFSTQKGSEMYIPDLKYVETEYKSSKLLFKWE